MKKALAILTAVVMLLTTAACSAKQDVSSTDAVVQFPADKYEYKYRWYSEMSPEEIAGTLTLEQKAAQMVQPAVYRITEADERKNDYGSILSTMSCIDAASWRDLVDGFQQAAIESEAGIPYIYGQDDVHGVNYCRGAVYFPHNIGQGAANDEELAYQVGLITADEAKLCHMMWNFSPVVAQSVDPRWGRTYESYGSDLDTITRLSTAYTKGLVDGGIVACAKHFFADGNVVYGTGEQGDIKMLIDRGDAQLTDAEINELLKVYQAQIDAGVQTIMISHSSLNGVKMHENKEYIMKLKDEMGFEGFIVSDWGSVGNITGSSYKEKVIKSVNAGIDMLMEPDHFEKARKIIVKAVKKGEISEERINDAVTRIIRVKKDIGLFDDPMLENITTVQSETGSTEYRAAAEKLVEESLVLLKNDNGTLPLKEGAKVYITGPAADNGQAQCGGWTMDWNGASSKDVPGCTTILEAFERYAGDYGIEIITDAKEAENADVVLLCVGEQSYAEWNGDTEDVKLCGKLGLAGNRNAIDQAGALDKPTVACIVAGRNVIIDPEDYGGWDSVVMCYLPGSEGKGVSDVLCGCADFTGRLPSPWYGSVDRIGTDECFLEYGYGLSYGEGFTPRSESAAVPDTAAQPGRDDPMSGTGYTKGLFKDGVYVNEYAGIKASIPGGLRQTSDSELEWNQQQIVSQCTNEKDRTRESARIIDSSFMGSKDYIVFTFLNTELGLPDNPNCTEEEYFDDVRDYTKALADMAGYSLEYEDRVKVQLGDKEYLRESCTVSGNTRFYWYARKLDDNLMCVIEVSGIKADMKPENYEALFV